MRAVLFERFGELPQVHEVPDPVCPPDGAVVRVAATGLCRSDWHAWTGHDPDVVLPHVPGHEFAGEIIEVGAEVRSRHIGERVTAPFVCACGNCASCRRGQHQVCDHQQQPGFTHWGSFAEYVVIDVADVNAVPLPDGLGLDVAASLGCRFATAYRAVVARGRVRSGDWFAVHGCGGLGLSAVMIAIAGGARVVAIDPAPAARERATALGAAAVLDPGSLDVPAAVREITGGGAAVSLDAIGGVGSLVNSIGSLRTGGRHVQAGLMGAATDVPADVIALTVARELELLGSHGMAAHDYPAMLARIESGELEPGRLIRRRIGLTDAAAELAALGTAEVDGITLIEP
ncbi:zinc-dependent alcohol dehydrogenase family protein [Jatrophihabitans cynanchi]|uniref:Zinc-dependent alcohol dehydrogenase family protein n=1 Tax=Jatrophihabitans cynanchi TaxID=2944128 RepID=A0ABY7K4F6_9ACTN|nr:zinc-dependent alcohol dehydrogenase family protein [Jatrophihabitans sp. SB3-54]WAX58156.1 zinc-dependent alcohol dehydrogenase family protein [Jatrophihabitans sp. SB3-54]